MRRFLKITDEYTSMAKSVLFKSGITNLGNDFIVNIEDGAVVNRGKFIVRYDNDKYNRVVLSYKHADQWVDLNGYPRYAYVPDVFFTIYKGVGYIYYDKHLRRKRLGLEGEESAKDKFANTFAYIMCQRTNIEPVQNCLDVLYKAYNVSDSNIVKVVNLLGYVLNEC